ncbi:MAG: redox-sensitive transcriptional activator SoxR [Rhizobiaceae bacterium]|nr:redox-sensitive transcriptional activator SoxR [Rhizobiaceae bacterium]
MNDKAMISIGKLSGRTGLAVSAIRYYEEQGLISSERNAGGQRRFRKSDIRRVSFILIAQKFGYPLNVIRHELSALPQSRTPTKADWTRLSSKIRKTLDQRIEQMQQMRDNLDGCIGCGCLSLQKCKLYNPDDKAAKLGKGPRYLLGNSAKDLED